MFKRVFCDCLNYANRKYATITRLKVRGDENTLTYITNEIYKPKHHPGIVKLKIISLPPYIVQAILHVIQDYPIKNIAVDSDSLARHLKGRVPPMEVSEVNETRQKVFEKILAKEKYIHNDCAENLRFKQKIKNKMEKKLKEKVYNWSPINYNTYNSLLYLFARSAPEYAVLTKIFSEINARDVNFKPRSMFDFGSGLGTATWAARLFWKDHIFEYFNVDISADINDLAQILLQKGCTNNTSNLKGIFYRQFLPANNTSYDVVISAYSMLELPSFQVRMESILKLWNKTSKYLVVVEQGTNAGFNVINQIRDFILQLQDNNNTAHVFSPCPHDKSCPRFLSDNTPCNFEVGYTKPFVKESKIEKERYSFVVLKKGERNTTDDEWPRVVRETLVRSKHTICRMCTKHGNLTETIFTASKHGKTLYHCARATKWGDRLPITVSSSTDVD